MQFQQDDTLYCTYCQIKSIFGCHETQSPNTVISYTELAAKVTKCESEMHENRYLFLFLIEINNMHRTRHILPKPWGSA